MNVSEYHYDKLIEAIESKKTIVQDFNINKVCAAQKATEARTAKAKKDIKLAILM